MEATFKQLVQAVVSGIKPGKVMTYGQIAAICGNARAARMVGGVAHFGDPGLPWHRVVNKTGGLASGFPGGRAAHYKVLLAEGYTLNERNGDNYVDLVRHLQKVSNE